ncbi:MAG: acetolactate synthase small subunit [Dehalococcoidia bacterium]
MPMTKHTLVVLAKDEPGVLNRTASLIRRRGFNIDSITVGHSEMSGFSRMVIIVDGATTAVEQVRKQLDKLVDIVKITDISEEDVVDRELALIKVEANSDTRSEIMEITDIFRANILDITPDSAMIEVTGDASKVQSLIELLRGFGITELARTGRIAMARGVVGPLRHRTAKSKGKASRPTKASQS